MIGGMVRSTSVMPLVIPALCALQHSWSFAYQEVNP